MLKPSAIAESSGTSRIRAPVPGRYWYGYPFPEVDEKDPKAAYKILYNHQVAPSRWMIS